LALQETKISKKVAKHLRMLQNLILW